MTDHRVDMYGKTHDTICSSSNAPNYSSCYCDLIAKVERRTLDAAEAAVAELTETGDSVRPADVMAAIQALKEKP